MCYQFREFNCNGRLQINICMKKVREDIPSKKQPQELIKTWLVDVWGHSAASQVGQVESGSHGNKAGRHLQDGQQPLCNIGHTIWCLEGKNMKQDCF